jgi:hypothetical protein
MDTSDSKHFSQYFILRYTEEHIDEVVVSTDKFFEDNPEYAHTIENYVPAFHNISDLIPATVDNFWSGNLFPYTEAEYELHSSIYFATRGFYKHALNSLLLQSHIMGSSRGPKRSLRRQQDLQDACPDSLFAPTQIPARHGRPGSETLG